MEEVDITEDCLDSCGDWDTEAAASKAAAVEE